MGRSVALTMIWLISYMGVHRVAAELQPRREGKRKRSRWSPHDDVVGY
jgi:hypothetical protein